MHNTDKPWFDDQCRHAFDLKQEAHLKWTRDRSRVNWKEFVRCQVRANETYSEAKHQFSVRNIDVLMNIQSPHKCGPLLSPLFLARVRHCLPWSVRVALRKLMKCEGGAGAEGAILKYVGHLQLISTLKIGADCCQLCQYKLT